MAYIVHNTLVYLSINTLCRHLTLKTKGFFLNPEERNSYFYDKYKSSKLNIKSKY